MSFFKPLVYRLSGVAGRKVARYVPISVLYRLSRLLPAGVRQRLRAAMYGMSIPAVARASDAPHHALANRALAAVRDIDPHLRFLLPCEIDQFPVLRVEHVTTEKGAAIAALKAADRAYKYVVACGSLGLGGAELYAICLYEALSSKFGRNEVVLLVTDRDLLDARAWLPDDANVLLLDQGKSLSVSERQYALRHFVAGLRPAALFNVNSAACWQLLQEFGPVLSRLTDVYSCVFCYDPRAEAPTVPGGYAALNFRDALAHSKGIIFDNATFREELIQYHGVPESLSRQMHVLYAPPRNTTRVNAPAFMPGGGIIWAGRFAAQKLPFLALDVARLCPDQQFHFYGHGEFSMMAELRRTAPRNAKFHGRYASLDVVLDRGFDMLLYTSITDGLPNVLLNACYRELPVVASATGGIAELVGETTGWLVADALNPAAYATAIRNAISQPREREERARAMKALVDSRHSSKLFADALEAVLSGEPS